VRFLILALALALLVLALLGWYSGYAKEAKGELRCEGRGLLSSMLTAKTYAVNGMASSRYPPIKRIWNSATHPEANIDRILTHGLTLCDW
jgi:hypothetical protein